MVNFLKFLHILFTLGLFGSTGYCLVLVGSRNFQARQNLHKIILLLATLALTTGLLLVYPKHYTFSTHWIQAAVIFVGVFSAGIFLLSHKIKSSFWLRVNYGLLLFILLIIIHDAVTKTTFW